MSFKYSLRFNLLPNFNVEERLERLISFCNKALIDDVMFFIDAEDFNTGHITIEEAKAYVEVIKYAKLRLAEYKITTSLNPWVTFLHGDRGRKLKTGQDFDLMVSPVGEVASATVCPLSKNWKKYFFEIYHYYATEIKPEILWIEDDFRMHNHEPLEYGGCFCKLHMDLFQKHLNEEISREEFVNNVLSPEADQRYREAYIAVNRIVISNLAKELAEHLKDTNVRLGLMTGLASTLLAEGRDQKEVFNNLSETKTPANRLFISSYRQSSPQLCGWIFNIHPMLSRSMIPEKVLCYNEIENFPHTLYSKSTNFSAFQLETSIPLILTGSTLNIFEFNGNGVLDEEGFSEKLSLLKPYLNTFKNLDLKFKQLSGVKVMVSIDSAKTLKTKSGEAIEELIPQDYWWGGYLGQVGISFEYCTDKFVKGDVIAIASQYLRNLSKEEIISLFKNNYVLINGDVIEVLVEYGLGHLAGIKDYERLQERTGLYSYEEEVQGLNLLGISNGRASSQYFCGDFYKIDYLGEQKVYTKAYNYDGSYVADAICEVSNVLILPYSSTDFPIGLFANLRERAIKTALRNSVFNKNIVFTLSPNLIPYFYEGSDYDVLILSNFSDDLVALVFETKKSYINIKLASKTNPVFQEISFKNENGIYRTTLKIDPLSTVLLILT
ncbi:MAG TPA: hypothetical protein GX692_00355 [Acholeplasmataceae bacterium]|nr:hypothetical protein [Acholeplasmataceae bacterium]